MEGNENDDLKTLPKSEKHFFFLGGGGGGGNGESFHGGICCIFITNDPSSICHLETSVKGSKRSSHSFAEFSNDLTFEKYNFTSHSLT